MTLPPVRVVLISLCASLCLGAASPPLNLWPGTAPGEKGDIGPEADLTKPTDALEAGRPVAHLGNVSVPTLTLYKAPAATDTGTTVVVFPGGGYYILAYDLEGTETCEWLNSIGVNAVLVKYRVPRREREAPYAVALQDAQRAVSTVRSRAAEWGLDPNRIGVQGYSAGGNLCAVLSASTFRDYARIDAIDDVSYHPDFQILTYPAYLVADGTYTVSPEVAITKDTPPTFMVMSEDDPVHVENILGYAMALKAANIPMELHVYPTGGHGYGLRPTKDFVTTWPARAADWMKSRGLLERK